MVKGFECQDNVLWVFPGFLDGNRFGTRPPTYVFDDFCHSVLPHTLDSSQTGLLLFSDLAVFSYLHGALLLLFQPEMSFSHSLP